MIKTLSKAQKMEREKFRIPRSVQDAIPIRRIFADGIFQVGNQYSKTWSFTDINYAIASKEDKTSMFLDYSELLNALDSGASAKITIYNRRINKAEFERSVLLPDKDDGLDEYRHEFNQMLTAQVTGTSNSIVRERYLTVSVVKRNADEARSYFARVGTDLVTHLAQLSSVATELTLNERLHIFRDFFKAGEQAAAEFNIHEHAKRGQHFKDWFCPDSMEFSADHFKLDARYGRVLYLQDYASYIKDSFVSELCDLDRDLMLSIDILPVPTDEAARQLQSTLLGVETNVANWQRRQNANNNFTATIPYDMELQRKETKEMLDDLTTRDQRMMFGLVTLVHLADSKEQLDSDTETLYSTARKHLCQLSTLRWQQKDGLDTVLPYGLRKIQALRTLTTESTAVLIPFRAQEIMEPNGLYYGQNAVSKNMIVADRRLLLNGNSFRLGVSGSGKSMSAKEEIVQIALSTEDDILILDPESEFGYLTEALGGEVIRISATSDTHINALDMDRAYGDERNPIEDYDATGLMSSYNRIGAVWAGGSEALLTGVLRDEWGFNGAVITDYADHHSYMNGDQALRAGGSLWMAGFGSGEMAFETSSNSYMQALRRATKEALYMYLHVRVTNRDYAESIGDTTAMRHAFTISVFGWRHLVVLIDIVVIVLFVLAVRGVVIDVKLRKAAKAAKENS